MSILIVGATGMVGGEIARKLASQSTKVARLFRRGTAHPKASQFAVLPCCRVSCPGRATRRVLWPLRRNLRVHKIDEEKNCTLAKEWSTLSRKLRIKQAALY